MTTFVEHSSAVAPSPPVADAELAVVADGTVTEPVAAVAKRFADGVAIVVDEAQKNDVDFAVAMTKCAAEFRCCAKTESLAEVVERA